MDGFELTRRLVSRRPKVPVIMITARAEQGLETRAAAAGAACLLKKPFEATALVGCIDRALGDRERMR
jgi:CheY-like chemotaxis protein